MDFYIWKEPPMKIKFAQNISSPPQKDVCVFNSKSFLTPKPNCYSDFCLFDYHINEIIQYTVFSIWPTKLYIISLRSIYVICSSNSIFYLLDLILLLDIMGIRTICSFFAFMNKDVMNILVHILKFLIHCVFVSLSGNF